VDLKFSSAEAGAEEAAALDAAGHHARGPDDDARPVRHRLLPALHAVNDAVGWISPGAVNEIGRRLQVAPAEVFGVASFYDLFAFEPRPPRRTLACIDLACRIAAGGDVAVGPDQHPSPCLGLCERAPATLEVGDGAPLPPGPGGSVPQRGEKSLVLLRRVGVVDPGSLEDYLAHGGGRALRRAVELGPAGVIAELQASKLAGRGGAAFPAGRKWAAVAEQPVRPHELVANADESEPGTFKDRVLLEGDPFAVVEAMTIAGFAVGAEHGYLYLRGEYPRARAALERAVEVARAAGLLGPDVGGHGFAFDLEIRRGAGAYICGEETAIFNSIEGYRGEPRNKPPFPVEVGLFGRPTLVNNVETLVAVLAVLEQGGDAYAAVGTDASAGTKLFAVSGAVARPGVYEVPFGVSLRALIDLAGGLAPRRTLQAVLLGGAAGALVGPDQLDLPLSFEATRVAGATLGSGVVMVLDERVDLPAFLVRVAEFFRHESCGQCVPCRVGTVRQLEILRRLAAPAAPASGEPGGEGSGEGRAGGSGRSAGSGARPAAPGDLVLLDDVAAVLKDASICGLGQLAANAVETARANLGVFQ
jgi:NADH-quinone oxidoreductase subunit F